MLAAFLYRQPRQICTLCGLVPAAVRVYLCTIVNVDQANREVTTRFDFKGTGSKFELDDEVISLTTQSDFQLKQMMDILHQKLSKRGIDIGCLDEQEPEFAGSEARQKVIMRRGIDIDRARKLVKQIKGAKLKKRDDLQTVITMLKDTDIGLPLQYENFRD